MQLQVATFNSVRTTPLHAIQIGGERPAPVLGGGSDSEFDEGDDDSEDEPMGRRGGDDDDDDDDASDGNEEQWAAIDQFAQRKSQPARGSSGSRGFSRIEDEVRHTSFARNHRFVPCGCSVGIKNTLYWFNYAVLVLF